MSLAGLHKYDKKLRELIDSKVFKEADVSNKFELSLSLLRSHTQWFKVAKGRCIKCRKIRRVINLFRPKKRK